MHTDTMELQLFYQGECIAKYLIGQILTGAHTNGFSRVYIRIEVFS